VTSAFCIKNVADKPYFDAAVINVVLQNHMLREDIVVVTCYSLSLYHIAS